MKKRQVQKSVLIGIGSLVILLLINFIPTFKLETQSMTRIEGEWVDVYYETEKAAAEDVFALAESQSKILASQLGFKVKQPIRIYIYDSQQTMQMKKYGYLGKQLGLDWYIGDNRGTDVILTSPAHPGKVHDYDSVKGAILHEMVHAYVSVMNQGVELWLTEGMALYLSNGKPFKTTDLEWIALPTFKAIQTRNPIYFQKIGGYSLAHTYIDYLEQNYGWESVIELIRTEYYEKVLGKTAEEIYTEWIAFLVGAET